MFISVDLASLFCSSYFC